MHVRYLALGDSYTIGEGVDPHERWPARLVHALRANEITVGDPHYIARTGWTCEELAAAIDADPPLGQWDLVTLCVGVNDQYRGHSVADFREQFSRVLERAIRLAGRRDDRVLVLTIPDWGVTPFAEREGRDRDAIRRGIDAFNEVIEHACEARRVTVVDVTTTSREGGDARSMLADDGLHPSGAMYARWVELIAPVAHTLLAPDA